MRDFDERTKRVTLTQDDIQEQIRKNLIEGDLFQLKNCNTLIIGLGGTGCTWARETKKLLKSRFDHKELDKHVKYLLFDSDENTLAPLYTGEPEQGNKPRKEAEFQKDAEAFLLSTQEFADYARRFPPQIKPWVNEEINYRELTDGAGQKRMGGRFYFYANSSIIEQQISKCLGGFKQDQTEDTKKTFIFLMSGLSGGTGSGCFIDTAFLVRKFNLGELKSPSFIALLELPDASIDRVGYTNITGEKQYLKWRMQNNGYCALQELDYYMKKYEGDGKKPYQFMYRNTDTLFTYEDCIFDRVYLLSHQVSLPEGGLFRKQVGQERDAGDGKKEKIFYLEKAVPEIVNSFLSLPNKRDDDIFDLSSKGSNDEQKSDHREAGTLYSSAGISKLEIPTDKILFCIIAKLFNEFSRRWDVDPGTIEKEEFYRRLELDTLYSRIKSSLRTRVKNLKKKDMQKSASDLANDIKIGLADDFKRALLGEDAVWNTSIGNDLRRLYKERGPVPLINLTLYALEQAEEFFRERKNESSGADISAALDDYNGQIIKGDPGKKVRDRIFDGMLGAANDIFETNLKSTRIAKFLHYNNDTFDKSKKLFDSFSGILNSVFNEDSKTITEQHEGVTTYSWDFASVSLSNINTKIRNMFRTKIRRSDEREGIPVSENLYIRNEDGEKRPVFFYKGYARDVETEAGNIYNNVEEITEEIIIGGRPLDGFVFEDVAQGILDIIFSHFSGEPVKGEDDNKNILGLVINRIKDLKEQIIGAGFEQLLLESSEEGNYSGDIPTDKQVVYERALRRFYFYARPSFPFTRGRVLDMQDANNSSLIITPVINDANFGVAYNRLRSIGANAVGGREYPFKDSSIMLDVRLYLNFALSDYYFLSELYEGRENLRRLKPQYIPGSHLSEGEGDWDWRKFPEIYTPDSKTKS